MSTSAAKKQSSLGSAGIGTRNPNLNLHAVKAGTADAEEDAWRVNIRGDEDLLLEERPSWWWTGKPPVFGECPGVDSDGHIHSLPLPDLASCTRQSVLEYFDNAWTTTEVLFSGLIGEEPFYRPPYHQLRHPMIFYYAHAAVVYINKLRVAGVFKDPINQYYEVLFETGVDEMSWDDLSKNEMEWPSVRECAEYRRTTYNMVKDIILNHEKFDTILEDLEKSPIWALFLAFEHERIHIETSSVLIRELPINLLRRPKNFALNHPSVPDAYSHPPVEGKDFPAYEFIEVEGEKAVLGKPKSFPSFGFDNEYGRKEIEVPSFKAGKFFVTNGAFWGFVNSGGYREKKYWTEAGWGWRVFRNAKWPTFWVPFGPQGLHQYKLRTLFEVVTMPWDWPAEVNVHEAKAFCSWYAEQQEKETGKKVQYRLNTEAEHQLLRDEKNLLDVDLPVEQLGALDPAMNVNGMECVNVRGFNYQLAYSSAAPVTNGMPNKKGFHDVFGNVWHWCSDFFCPFPGFDVHFVYDDFSTPCFGGKHHVILGGSYISTGQLASSFARYQFRPHFFQHAGFRMVEPNESEVEPLTTSRDAPPPYFGSDAVAEVVSADDKRKAEIAAALKEAYGSADEKLPSAHAGPLVSIKEEIANFCSKVASIADEHASKGEERRVMDVGCGVGGLSHALSHSFNQVVGIDAEEDILEVAKDMSEHGTITTDGDLTYTAEKKGDLSFRLADACCLPLDMGKFDCVVLSRILDKVPSPKAALGRFGGVMGLLKTGGVVVVVNSDEYKEEYAPKGAWLDTSKEGPELEGLGSDFSLVHSTSVSSVVDGKDGRKSFEVNTYNVRVYKRA